MAKELPYFQFEPAEYLTKDITLCSLESQGLFINIVCFYWQRGCSLPLATLKRRFNHPKLIEELEKENVIKIRGGSIIIEFLDKQYKIITKRKKLLSAAGRKGANIKQKKALLKPPLKQAKATLKHIDKIKVDKIKEDYIKKYPDALNIVKHFIETLETDNRYIPKTDTQKLEWLKVAQWSINQMGENGYQKVIDIIDFFRNGHADNNNFSWSTNWLSLKKLQNKNRDGVTYLDYFWEKAKTKFEYK